MVIDWLLLTKICGDIMISEGEEKEEKMQKI